MTDTALSSGDEKRSHSSRRHLIQNVVAVVLLATSAAVAARTVSEAIRHDRINAPLALTPFATEADKAAHLHDVVDTFATGDSPGDRVMTIRSDGRIEFSMIGPLGKALQYSDRYQIGQRGRDLWLATDNSGMIQALSIDQLSYFDDVYQRRSK